MIERILVPLDGSKYSEEILPVAAGLARVPGTTLTLMRVVRKESEKAEAESWTEALAASVSAQPVCLVARADVADTILEEARQVPGTLVAMTSHGRSGVMEAMLGSVALRVVRGADAPVLVYRPLGEHERGRTPVKVTRIVLPLGGTQMSEAMAPQAAELAKRLDAELFVVSVLDPSVRVDAGVPAGDVMESSYVRARAGDYAARYGVRVNWETLHGKPADAITRFIDGRKDVILAMATRGRRPIESAFLGSVTAGCLRTAGVPVLMRMP